MSARMGLAVPGPVNGIQFLLEEIVDANPDVTEAAVGPSASAFTTFATVTNGSTTARALLPTYPLLLFLSGLTQVVAGEIAFTLESPDAFRSRVIRQFGANEFDTVSNQRSALFKKTFASLLIAGPNYKIRLQTKNNDVATTTAATQFSITAAKALNVPFDLFARSYRNWLI